MSTSLASAPPAATSSPTDAAQQDPFVGELWSALRLDDADSRLPGGRLPIPHLSTPAKASSVRYTVTAIDVGGRLADRTALTTLGWQPGRPVNTSIIHGVVVVLPGREGRHTLTRQGRLRLPSAIRQLLRLNAGDRLLLAACADRQLLLIYPPAALDSMILAYHSTADGREKP